MTPQIEGTLCGVHTDSPAALESAGGGLAARGVITMEPGDQTGYFILSVGARKWKCQSGEERMNVMGAMAPPAQNI